MHAKRAFLTHYNGYVFGTNMSRMFTIREREIGLHNSLPEEVEVVSEDSSRYLLNEQVVSSEDG